MIDLEEEVSSNLESDVEKICCQLFQKYSLEKLMELAKSSENIYILLNREHYEFLDIYRSNNGVDSFEFIAIPVPKRFAVLEPDKNYFEITLKANIALALRGERDFHL